MTGLISLVLILMGGIVLVSAGMLKEEGKDSSANFCLAFGFILLLCAWWLA